MSDYTKYFALSLFGVFTIALTVAIVKWPHIAQSFLSEKDNVIIAKCWQGDELFFDQNVSKESFVTSGGGSTLIFVSNGVRVKMETNLPCVLIEMK